MSVLIIAEAGVNHNGSIELAKELIDIAADAGADIVKFQTFKTELLVSKEAQKASYQVRNTGNDELSQYDMLKNLELDKAAHEELIRYCRKRDIRFLSTAFDLESIDLLQQLGVDIYKIPSGEITNLPYLRKVASLGREIILSTGMSTLVEVAEAMKVLQEGGCEKEKITLLHCNTEYPTPMEDVNLKAMLTLKETFGVQVGYSDHTMGIEVPVAAVALGAACIEKHFTISRELEGPDHLASLEPDELKAMVSAIRNIEKALGSGLKQPSASEVKNISIARKSIHLSRELEKGHIITEHDLVMKRPGDGISPMDIEQVIGKKVNRTIPSGSKLEQKDLE